ncbi:phospholipid phosphatase 2-like [Bubalus kerabau]|uniref:phospholipid phosphatase 2-like n=1 Tax=Bubalus carabanensis TaxID=3119969 RepID=UPI00244EE46C|nr:phospholipid phosphatase 2-like [Bubalus carabanensis]
MGTKMQPRGVVPLITLSQGFKALPPAFQLYIQAGSWGQKIWLLRPTIQLLFLSLALLTGYIRVLDHWHHPYDAFFGFLQGALMAFWVVFYIAGNAKSQSHLCSVCHVPPHFPSLYSFPEDPQGTRGMP